MAEMDFKNPPKENEYPKCPAGIHNAICVDVVDRGHRPKTFQGVTKIKPQAMYVFETEERNELGYRHRLFNVVTVSTHVKSNMAKTLFSWIGDKLKTEKFDPESVIGLGAQVNVIHDPRDDGSVGVFVSSVLPKHKHDPDLDMDGYVRYKDRDDWIAPVPSCWESGDAQAAAPVTPATTPPPAAAATQPALPAEEIPPPAVPKPKPVPTKTSASQQPATEEEVDAIITFAMDLFEGDKVMGFIQEAAMKITKQDNIRNLTSNQLFQVKAELRGRKPTDFKVKSMPRPEEKPLTDEQLADGLGEDPFKDE